MQQKPNDNQLNVILDDVFKQAHRFSYDAMGTVFEILILNDDAQYAHQAAAAAFDELLRIEQQLSRFLETSDISIVNQLAANRPMTLTPDAFDCIKLSIDIFKKTSGAFDITTGLLYNCFLDDNKELLTPSNDDLQYAIEHTGSDNIKLNDTDHTIELSTAPVAVDLGGIGKGYALNIMARLLKEWSIDYALLHGGYSSVLALDAPEGTNGWPVTFSDPDDRQKTIARVELANAALSASGLQKGSHIIDPAAAKPLTGKFATWVITQDAAVADALSTAFMIMTDMQIETYCNESEQTRGLRFSRLNETENTPTIKYFGDWKTVLYDI
ncbi:MAG: FAD:protein FMN transferase [Planctomycetes bacterium]|nr:FAD:protein FMN transferase [Planctomycetota bacterium]